MSKMNFKAVFLHIIFTSLILFVKGSDGIELRHVNVPAYALQGRNTVLECDYDLEGQALYSVKWYKNGMEFYRYLPSRKEPITYYVRPGVNVDNENSNARQVSLVQLTQQSTGRYRCEVSTEAPSFATVSSYGDMQVVVPPRSGPTIEGWKQRYSLGDQVSVNCTSANSKPAADLFWTINGDPADDGLLVKYPMVNTSSGLHTSILGLRFAASKDFYTDDGDLKLKCTANIGSVYWQSIEKSAEGFKHKRASYTHSDGFYDKRDSSVPALDSPHGLSSDYHSGSSSTKSDRLFLIGSILTTLFVRSSAHLAKTHFE